MGIQGMPDHTQEKFHDQTTGSMDILLHPERKLYTTNNFWDIKIMQTIKIMQSDWSRAFSITTRTRFFRAMYF